MYRDQDRQLAALTFGGRGGEGDGRGGGCVDSCTQYAYTEPSSSAHCNGIAGVMVGDNAQVSHTPLEQLWLMRGVWDPR